MMSLIRLSAMNLMRLIQIIMNFILCYSDMKRLVHLAAFYLQKVSTVEQAEHSVRNTNTLTSIWLLR